MRKCLVIILLLCCGVRPAEGQPTFFDQIDVLVDSYAEQDLFSGSVLVARDGEVYSNGYGMANRSWNQPNTADTRFRVASLTKPFTATLILQLVEQGTLSLNDPLYVHLPEYPAEYGADVTIHHLLNHTSGIPSYTNFTGWADTTSRIEVNPGSFLAHIGSKPLAFEPGTSFQYSNSNYYLLGVIIEKATGMSYSRILEEQILKPGRLTNTGYLFNHMVVDRLAEGYDRLSNGYYEKAPYQSPSTAYAAGGIYSDVNDLYNFSILMNTDRLLGEEYRSRMMTAREHNYGYGWVIGNIRVDDASRFLKSPFTFKTEPTTGSGIYRLLWHWGSNPGYHTLLIHVPEQQWTIVILENQNLVGDPEGTKIFDIAAGILQRLHKNRVQ